VARELVADEKLVHQELHLVAVQLDKVAPPLLETEVAFALGVDIGIEVVLLAPQPIGGGQFVEVQNQPRAIELAAAEIAGQRSEPAAAEQAACIAYRIFAVDALPIRHR